MTTKTIYMLNIDNYLPELTELCLPTVRKYAQRIGAEILTIRTRKFLSWPVTYEKLQIYELEQVRRSDWAIYIDSDVLIHPEMPDITELIPPHHVAHNANDFAPLRWVYDDYLRRDGRHIGSCNWFACAPASCIDLWRPLEMLPHLAIARIHPTGPEVKFGMKAEHLIDDYALSRNIARFGLKFTTLRELWRNAGIPTAEFLWHEYLLTPDQKVEQAAATLLRWGS